MAEFDVAVLLGSLRKESYTRRVSDAVIALAPAHLKFRYVEIGKVSLYNQDLDTDAPPAEWRALRDEIRAADAVLFATPEYNRSVPGALKNAIDIASRPYGKNVFAGKPSAVLSVTPGALGAFGANHHLRQSLTFLDAPVLQQPEMYIANAGKLLNEQGDFASEEARKLAEKFVTAFTAWIEKLRK